MLAAGLAPEFVSLPTEHADLKPVFSAVERLLRNHAPYPALVLDGHWNIVNANDAARNLLQAMGYFGHHNIVEAILGDSPQTTTILNWEEVVADICNRLVRDAADNPNDEVLGSLVERLQRLDVSDQQRFDAGHSDQAVLPLRVRVGGRELAFFSILSSLQSVRDVSVRGLSAELFFPLDEATETYLENAAAPLPLTE